CAISPDRALPRRPAAGGLTPGALPRPPPVRTIQTHSTTGSVHATIDSPVAGGLRRLVRLAVHQNPPPTAAQTPALGMGLFPADRDRRTAGGQRQDALAGGGAGGADSPVPDPGALAAQAGAAGG